MRLMNMNWSAVVSCLGTLSAMGVAVTAFLISQICCVIRLMASSSLCWELQGPLCDEHMQFNHPQRSLLRWHDTSHHHIRVKYMGQSPSALGQRVTAHWKMSIHCVNLRFAIG